MARELRRGGRGGLLSALVLALALLTGPATASEKSQAKESAKAGTAVAEQALCPVCRVKEGATEHEDVKATRTHDGVTYGFCSDACAKEFDADPAAYVAPSFPRPAPSVLATTLEGQKLDWTARRGKLVLVDFWATWCVPCRESMPELQQLHARYKDRGFEVLGVSIDEGGPSKVKRYLKGKTIQYPIALDDAKDPTWHRFMVKAIPAAFLVDGEGRIVAQWTGRVNVEEVEAEVVARLKKIEG